LLLLGKMGRYSPHQMESDGLQIFLEHQTYLGE
jgi:hypothetical protein